MSVEAVANAAGPGHSFRAAFRQEGKMSLQRVARTAIAPDEIRVQVKACGICGSDLHPSAGPSGRLEALGHEVAGVVLDVGGAVNRLRPGDRVVLESSSACGRCASCRNARPDLCFDVRSLFGKNTLGFADEIVAPGISAVPSGDLPPEVACLSEPLAVALDMVRLAEIQSTSHVLIMGAGPIGLMALALVRRQGARRVFVSAYARQKARARLALQLGADALVDPERNPLESFRFDASIDRILVTSSPATLPVAFKVAGRGAIVTFIGIGSGATSHCTFDANAFHFKKLQLRGSFASPALCTPLALQLLRDRVIDGPALVSHTYSLGRIELAMARARRKTDAIKVVVTP
jgi:L-iditol 2-dehydrogenase